MWRVIKYGEDPSGRAVKAWVFGRSLAGIAGLNPASIMGVGLLWVLCVAR